MIPAQVDQALTLPPDEAAARLSTLPENQWFERKSGRVKPQDFAVPLVAMANAEGGTIVVGLTDGRVDAVSDSADNQLRQAAMNFTSPNVRAMVHELSTSQGRVLVFHVPPSDHVHETHRGECYQRIGDESRRLTYAQRQELEWDRNVASFDGTPAPGATVADLDPKQLHNYQLALGSSSTERALRARDLLTRSGDITVAGFLLFSARPQVIYPNAQVRVLRYAENERGAGRHQNLEAGADIRCEGPLPQQIELALTAVEELLPRRKVLGSSGRFESTPIIPRDAWLEGLVNAVVHRSYSISGDHIRVEIFPNRMEITSPGRFPGLADTADPESISRNARNPRITRVAADLGITQELGEGIRRIFSEMRVAGLTDPLYTQSSSAVRLTLLASNAISRETEQALGASAMRVWDALRVVQRPLGTGQIVELVGLARPTVLRSLNKLRESNLVVWEGDSPRDPRATWRPL
ncbi:ATP-binding protein [Tessaracoccus sp. OH4464_COT-324]|uniref:ATP-binding protein n=1 Tax=Tessaracoccus sp. OH4464_COT-324 TaxID=2491059 RepID=UPI000F63EF42|nr:ATP-binding protein [Tessaracoccus sp. OH4464_COT-324]RRD46332.1 ArsR family transcriptional regulator [Tessaracoccus sp. OH4464_COT-324]